MRAPQARNPARRILLLLYPRKTYIYGAQQRVSLLSSANGLGAERLVTLAWPNIRKGEHQWVSPCTGFPLGS
jgi:hypothetical protein